MQQSVKKRMRDSLLNSRGHEGSTKLVGAWGHGL